MMENLPSSLALIGMLIVVGSIGLAGLLLVSIMIYEDWTINAKQISGRPTTIVVFGAYADDIGPSRELEHRLKHAIHLWKQSRSYTIAVSGGYSHHIDETSVMSAYLDQAGVDTISITEIRPGHSTQATIRSMATSPINSKPSHHWLAVSSGYHALRIHLWGWAYALNIKVSCPHGPRWRSTYYWQQRLREMVAVLASGPSILTIKIRAQQSVDIS